MADFIVEEEESAGLPAWMATFADLMSLLMCFFVLLLSFSEMDLEKFKLIAGSMKKAFGVQNEVRVNDIPKGTSVIAREFSPGAPRPTPKNVIRQDSANTTKNSLDNRVRDPGTHDREKSMGDEEKQTASHAVLEKIQNLIEETERDVQKLSDSLREEAENGYVDIESGWRSITIRIREKGSFGSGSAILQPEFVKVMAKLRNVLSGIEGKFAVEGHTDNIPISTRLFPSNWDLSSARALSVAHELLKDNVIDDSRFMIVGYADTKPFVDNTSSENRAANRRVEIVIHQGIDEQTSKELKALEYSDPSLMESLDLEDTTATNPLNKQNPIAQVSP